MEEINKFKNYNFPERWEYSADAFLDQSKWKIFLFGYDNQLSKEVGLFHPLFKFRKKAIPIACRDDCDDRLYYIPQNKSFVVVHLTWSGGIQLSKDTPTTSKVFNSLDEVFGKLELKNGE